MAACFLFVRVFFEILMVGGWVVSTCSLVVAITLLLSFKEFSLVWILLRKKVSRGLLFKLITSLLLKLLSGLLWCIRKV